MPPRRFPSTLGVLNALRAWLGQSPPLDSIEGLGRVAGLEDEGTAEEGGLDAGAAQGSELDDALEVMSNRTRSIESVLLRNGSAAAAESAPDSGGGSNGWQLAESALREAMCGALVNRHHSEEG